jgi:hypothetical protein
VGGVGSDNRHAHAREDEGCEDDGQSTDAELELQVPYCLILAQDKVRLALASKPFQTACRTSKMIKGAQGGWPQIALRLRAPARGSIYASAFRGKATGDIWGPLPPLLLPDWTCHKPLAH